MENNKDSKNLAQQIALQVLKDYEQKHKDSIVKISNATTTLTPIERTEALHKKVRAKYMKKLLSGLEKK